MDDATVAAHAANGDLQFLFLTPDVEDYDSALECLNACLAEYDAGTVDLIDLAWHVGDPTLDRYLAARQLYVDTFIRLAAEAGHTIDRTAVAEFGS